MRERITKTGAGKPHPRARYVLYWCRVNRRVESNHALVFAIGLANDLGLPVLVHESLPCNAPHDSRRTHQFILEGVPEFARGLAALGIGYAFHLQRRRKDPENMLAALAPAAAAIVTDDYPRLAPGPADYAVDSSCIVPMNCLPAREYAAYTIRPKIRKLLPKFLVPVETAAPARPYRDAPPDFHVRVTAENAAALAAGCDVDGAVPSSRAFRGGRRMAGRHLERFLTERLRRYARDKNQPAAHATSELSPYLHSGHLSSLEVALAAHRHAEEHRLIADEFLDELIVRRELAFNFARHAPAVDSLDALPEWARETLRAHARDRRDPVYGRAELENAATHDDLWNAAQKELLLRGKIHGYYRMYWGKKILEWSASPAEALAGMIYLNDLYALDGRDANTYANLLWCLGLHDRPWPERPIFGKIRSMSRDGMERKTATRAYLGEILELERSGMDPYALR